MKHNKQKTAYRETLTGKPVYNVALDRNGIAILSDNMGFMTISRTSGKVRSKGKQ